MARLPWFSGVLSLNLRLNEITFKCFNFGFPIADWWLLINFVGSTQHIWHAWWATYGLVCFGDFGSLCQLNCKYKRWTYICKVYFSNYSSISTIFLDCKVMVPLILVISGLSLWLNVIHIDFAGTHKECTMHWDTACVKLNGNCQNNIYRDCCCCCCC